jgi:pimeloyl-ACP methyl ester carboxylesterase
MVRSYAPAQTGTRVPAAEEAAMLIATDGAEFDVRDEGRGPALVLLHGFPLAKEIWDAQAAALAGVARIVRFDLRGLGSTTVTPGPYLMEQLAGDLVEILDALQIERAVIAGHSLGGYVALAFFRMFSERCAGLGLINSRVSADTPGQAAGRLELAARAEREGMAPIVEAFLPRFFAPGFAQRSPELAARAEAIVARTDPRGAAAMLRGMAARVPSDDLFDELTLPVALVAGSHDAIISLEETRATARALSDATLEVLECGHSPWYEAPDALNAALQRLLERVASRV